MNNTRGQSWGRRGLSEVSITVTVSSQSINSADTYIRIILRSFIFLQGSVIRCGKNAYWEERKYVLPFEYTYFSVTFLVLAFTLKYFPLYIRKKYALINSALSSYVSGKLIALVSTLKKNRFSRNL